MKLPHPHRIAEALPGNLRSGRPREQALGVLQQTGERWGPVRRSHAGLPEIAGEWVAAHLGELTLVDVRSAEEFTGPDGHIPGSRLLPLPELEAHLAEIPTERPVVVVCHAGSRSALATQQLLKAGHQRVANLRGGLRLWSKAGYPLEGHLSA